MVQITEFTLGDITTDTNKGFSVTVFVEKLFFFFGNVFRVDVCRGLNEVFLILRFVKEGRRAGGALVRGKVIVCTRAYSRGWREMKGFVMFFCAEVKRGCAVCLLAFVRCCVTKELVDGLTSLVQFYKEIGFIFQVYSSDPISPGSWSRVLIRHGLRAGHVNDVKRGGRGDDLAEVDKVALEGLGRGRRRRRKTATGVGSAACELLGWGRRRFRRGRSGIRI